MILPDHKIQEVCHLFLAGHTKSSIARQMGISRMYVNEILKGDARKDVARPAAMADPADAILDRHQGPIVRSVRLVMGLSQADFARILRLNPITISDWERERTRLSPATRRRFLSWVRNQNLIHLILDYAPPSPDVPIAPVPAPGPIRQIQAPGPSDPSGIRESLDAIDAILDEEAILDETNAGEKGEK